MYKCCFNSTIRDSHIEHYLGLRNISLNNHKYYIWLKLPGGLMKLMLQMDSYCIPSLKYLKVIVIENNIQVCPDFA